MYLVEGSKMRKCKLCEKQHYGLGYCKNHYRQYKTKLRQKEKRTIHTPNEIRLHKDYAEVVLYNIKCEEVGTTLIDLEDVPKVRKYKWFKNKQGYVNNNKIGRLHRYLLNVTTNSDVDHINLNTLDNRKSNLRVTTRSQNCMNKDLYVTNTSKVTGVNYHTQRNKWRAYITVNYKTKHLGLFDTIEEAIKIRKEAEEKYFGEYARK